MLMLGAEATPASVEATGPGQEEKELDGQFEVGQSIIFLVAFPPAFLPVA